MDPRSDATRRTQPPIGTLPTSIVEPGQRVIVLRVDPRHLRRHWSQCGATADYLALFALQAEPRDRVLTASNVFNELVENAVKYAADACASVELTVWRRDDLLTVQTRHTASPSRVASLRVALSRLRSHTTEALIEAHAGVGGGSGVGLVALVREHGAVVGAALELAAAGETEVTLQVQFVLAGDEGGPATQTSVQEGR